MRTWGMRTWGMRTWGMRTWGMRLNKEKCKVMHFGKSNQKEVYCMKKILRVQKRATRIPTGFEKLKYEERLRRLSLTTLYNERGFDRDV